MIKSGRGPRQRTRRVLLIEAAGLVEPKLVAGRAQIKANVVRAVLAVVAAPDDWADPAAVTPHPAHHNVQCC